MKPLIKKLYLLILTGLPITILFGVLVRQELVGSQKLGKISETALFLAEIPKNIKYIISVKKKIIVL